MPTRKFFIMAIASFLTAIFVDGFAQTASGKDAKGGNWIAARCGNLSVCAAGTERENAVAEQIPRAGQSPAGWSAPPPALRRRITDLSSRVPLSFEANQGQTAPQVRFLSRGQQYTLFLTRDRAVFAFEKPADQAVLSMQLLHSNANASIQGMHELAARSNYFKGSNPTQWRTNIRNYARV